jgi:hypothetical protein
MVVLLQLTKKGLYMGENGSRSLNRAFLPGQQVAPPGEQADLTDLENRVTALEAANVALTARVATLEARQVPGGGFTGMQLTKTTDAAYDMSWQSASTVSEDVPSEEVNPEVEQTNRPPRAKHT